MEMTKCQLIVNFNSRKVETIAIKDVSIRIGSERMAFIGSRAGRSIFLQLDRKQTEGFRQKFAARGTIGNLDLYLCYCE